MTLITHNLQGGELKPISCAPMQDLFLRLGGDTQDLAYPSANVQLRP